MELVITLNQNELKTEIRQKGRVLDPVKPLRGHGVLGRGRQPGRLYVLDFETAKYYHDISDVLTPLEVTDIIKKGFTIKGSTVIYGELLTGLISSLDKLLKRNRVDVKVLKSYKILTDLGQDSTSYKIASAFLEGLKVSC